jgi:hypothetical protein
MVMPPVQAWIASRFMADRLHRRETVMGREWSRRQRPRSPAFVLLTATLAGLAAAPLAFAGVYKCQGDGGGVVYQEDPCPAGRELRNLEQDPPDLSVIHGGTARPAGTTGKTAASRTVSGDKAVGTVGGDPNQRKFIRTGMTEAEVLARIGRPDATAGGKKGQTHWSYLPAAGDPDTVTSIHFAAGVVSEVTRKVIKR